MFLCVLREFGLFFSHARLGNDHFGQYRDVIGAFFLDRGFDFAFRRRRLIFGRHEAPPPSHQYVGTVNHTGCFSHQSFSARSMNSIS